MSSAHPMCHYGVQILWVLGLPAGLFALPTIYVDADWPVSPAFFVFGVVLVSGLVLASGWRRLLVLRQNAQEVTNYNGAYVLFLRSFSGIDGFQLHQVTFDNNTIVEYETSSVGELDDAVRLAGLRMVALGGDLVLPKNHGVLWLAGDDADWQANATRLAEGARAVLLLPETTEGLITEIRLLRDRRLLGRTIVAMFPLPEESTWVEYRNRSARVIAWERAQARLAAEGIALPDYDPRGAIFRLDDDGTAVDLVCTSGDGELVRELGRLLARCQDSYIPFNKVYKCLDVRREVAEPVLLLFPPGSNGLCMGAWAASLIQGVLFNGVSGIYTCLQLIFR